MDLILRFLQLGLGAVVFFAVLYLMIKRKSNESVSLIWLIVGFGAMILGAFPTILNRITSWLHIDYQPIFVVVIAVVFLVCMLFYVSNELAVSNNKINELTIQISLLNRDVKELRNQMEEMEKVAR